MLLILHIAVAVASLGYTAYVLLSPAQSHLRVIYVLVGLTVLSGVVLIITKPAHMTQTCTTGLVYLAVMFFGIVAIRHRLANLKAL